jgi:hypothetical protein
MRFASTIARLGLFISCSRGSQHADVDTSMVFVAMPSADSSKTPPSRDSLFATLSAYSHKRITADQAASVIVDYMQGGKSFNAAMDDQLQEAITREYKRRTAGH